MKRRIVVLLASLVLVVPAALTPVVTSVSHAQSVGSFQGVTWSGLVNCSASGSALEKVAGRDDTYDAGASSAQEMPAGDVTFQFSAMDSAKALFCGLAHNPIGTNFDDIDFAIKLTTFGVAEVRENNNYRTETSYHPGDTFRIVIQSGVATYYKNEALLYASLKAATFPLRAKAAFATLGARVESASIGALAMGPTADWKMYQHDVAHSGVSASSAVSATNAGTLGEIWSFKTGGWVTGTPVVSGGAVYVGSWDGKMYALRESDGHQLWSFTADNTSDNCGATYGIDSTAALSGGKLYFGSAGCNLYALDASTGALIWKTTVDDPAKGFHLWSSPLVVDGRIHVGLASHCDHPCVRGRVVCVDASDGKILWTFYAAPDGSTGAGVWSSFAIDANRRLVYATSGNFCEGSDTYGDSIIALDADDGHLAWYYKNGLRNRDVENLDFGASPVLFDSAGREVLAACSKDGYCYEVDRGTGELIWSSRVTDGSTAGGIISSPAAAYGMVFIGASVESQSGKVVALDQRDGQIVWEVPQAGPVVGAIAVSGGAVFVGGSDGALHAFDARTGAEIWSATRDGQMWGGVSISQNKVFVGSTDENVYAFGLPGSGSPPPKPTIFTTSPVAGDVWAAKKKHTIMWNAGSGVDKVDVSISRDGGATWSLLASGLDAAAGSFRKKIKKPRTERAVIRVSDSADSTIVGLSGVFSVR